jgi:hypothetical protein
MLHLLQFQDTTFTNCGRTPNQTDITDFGKDATRNGHTVRLGGGILWVVIQAAIYVINHFAHSYLILLNTHNHDRYSVQFAATLFVTSDRWGMVTANVRTEGASENFLFWDFFKELLVTQSVLHRFG